MPSNYVIDPEDEDPGFFDDFARVIDDAQLKHADKEYLQNVEITSDPFVGMEMASSRGAEGEMVHPTVCKRV